MPKPYSEELQKYAEQQNPRARMILETVQVTSEDIKDTRADWSGADDTTGWDIRFFGGARPSGTPQTMVSYATGTDDIVTSMPGITGATVGAAIVRWAPNAPDELFRDITTVTARLDPNADGGGVVVEYWTCTLYRQAEVNDDDWTLEQITSTVRVQAGATVDEVTFNFPGVPATIGVPAPGETRPRTIIVIGALNGAGEVATNVAWVGNSAVNTATSNGHDLDHENFLEINNQTESQTLHVKQLQTASGLPRFTIEGRTFTQQTIEFTGANAPTLAAPPTDTVEFMLEDVEPGGSAGQGYVRNNGSTTWVAFNDGQTVTDLGGVSSTGPVYEMRYIATPSTSGYSVPTVYRMGVRELTRETLDGIARIGNPMYRLDPFTLKASIPELAIELTRDGVEDYRDFATELFSDHHAGEIEFRVHYGHPDLDRQYWTYIDQFRLNDYETAGESVVVETIHPLALLKETIPKASTTGQDPVVFSGTTDTTATAYGDILDTVGLPGRYRGVELEPFTFSTSYTPPNVSKTIARPRPAKDELDRLAFIDGAAVIPSGGRLKVTRFWTSTGGLFQSPVEHFENVAPLSVSPHLDRRIISYRVPYGYSQALDGGQGGFVGAVLQQSTSGISRLGHAALDPVQDLDDETARWLLGDSTSVGSVLGAAIARRTVQAFRQGAIGIRFRADHPRPWLELGDVVEVKTDKFVGRGLETDRALRGRLSVMGPIIQHDMNGTEFTVLVPEIETSTPSPLDISVTYADPEIAIGTPFIEPNGTVSNDEEDMAYNIGIPVQANNDCRSVKVGWGQQRPSSSTATTPTLTGYGYWFNISGVRKIDRHVLVATTDNSNSAPTAFYTSTASKFQFLVQPNGGTPLSDTEDDEAVFSGPNAGRILVTMTPYAEAVVPGSTSRPVIAGTIQQFRLPPLKNQGSPSRYADGTNTYTGHQLRVGAGLTLGISTDGYPQISLST